MDFSLTDDQQLLRDTATKLLERECPPALVRAHIDDPAAYEPLWRHLREFTALGAGPGDRPVPLPRADRLRGRARTVPRDRAVHVAHRRRRRDHRHRRVPRRPDEPVRARSRPRRADRARRPRPDGRGRRRPRALQRSLRFVSTVDFSRRVVPARHRRPRPRRAKPIDAERFDAWRDRAHVSIAAEMTGTARRIFDMALAYAKERKQFDRPIGSFQAIQHKLADMSLALATRDRGRAVRAR